MSSYRLDFIRTLNVTFGADRLGIRQEELFQPLWIPASNRTNRIGSLEAFLHLCAIG